MSEVGPPTDVLHLAPRMTGGGTLARRLILQVVALVALVAVALSLLTTLAVRQLMLNQLDRQVNVAAGRVGWDGRDGPRGRGNGPRQQVGTVIVVVPLNQSGVGHVLRESAAEALDPDLVDRIAAATAGETRTTSTIDGLGRYRFGVRTFDNGRLVTGLPMTQVDRVIAGLIGLELILALLAMAGSALGARALVTRSLRPLNRLAATATQVSQLPLDRGEVALAVRVPPEDADPRNEVGRVGEAFNHMLSNVDGALAARQASEMKVRQFVADASHELRNPLAAIRGYAELTRRSWAELPADTAHAMARVESEAGRMSHLVEDLLLLARLDSGPDLNLRPTDLTELVLNAVSDAQAAGPQHVWTMVLPDTPVMARGDAHRLHQVLANLLANARTHTPPGTRVETGLAVEEGRAVLTVTDDGPGIPPEIQPRVFQRFTRADASRARTAGTASGGSTGLGLAIVAAVVEAHAGQVEVDSQPGRTRFTVRLPLAS